MSPYVCILCGGVRVGDAMATDSISAMNLMIKSSMQKVEVLYDKRKIVSQKLICYLI